MELTMPNIVVLEESTTLGKFVIEPLERGYGTTLGNALRRVMLSSVEGAAITHVKIEGVAHEFQTISGVTEDTTELLLNLKELFVRIHRSSGDKFEPTTIRINRKGQGRVTGADVDCPPDIDIVNPEVYLATISDENASLQMEMTVEVGVGYVQAERQDRKTAQPIGVIPLGAAFTPVRKVNYTVEATRIGFKTDLERLTLDVTTNGTMTPGQSIREAAAVLCRYFSEFISFDGGTAGSPLLEGFGRLGSSGPAAPDVRIEELDFSVRTYNCLKKANILTVAELIATTQSELLAIKNFGKKSLIEVHEKLKALGLDLKGGVSVDKEDSEEEEENTD